jgi:membrane protease YdiL (CAAX protease family)
MSVQVSSVHSESSSGLKHFVVQHPLLVFYTMALVLTWLVALPLIVSRPGADPAKPIPYETTLIAGAIAGPTLSALFVIFLTGGMSAVRAFLKRYAKWRVGLVWWLIVIFGPLLALNTVAGVFLGVSVWANFLQNLPLALAAFFPNLILGVILGPLWEEPGWRGFALPRLQKRYGPLVGTIIVGILWGLWHLPGFFGGWLPPLNPSSLAALLVSTVGFSFIMTWIYNHTDGSILLMILFHSANSAAIALGGKVLPADIPASLQPLIFNAWIPAITHIAFGLLIVIITRGKLGYKED